MAVMCAPSIRSLPKAGRVLALLMLAVFAGGCAHTYSVCSDGKVAPAEVVVLSVEPSNYGISGGCAAQWRGKELTGYITRWNDRGISAYCYELSAPPGPQKIEVFNIWANGWGETLQGEFVARPGGRYAVRASQEPDPAGMHAKQPPSTGKVLLGVALVPFVGSSSASMDIDDARPNGALCSAWVEDASTGQRLTTLLPLRAPPAAGNK